MPIWRNLEKNKDMINRAAKSGNFIILDTETTGLKKDDEIIEFAACKCKFAKGRFTVFGSLHIYIKPSKPVPEEISEINGITNEFLADKNDEKFAYKLIRRFLGDHPVIGAYNSPFDVRMIRAMYERNHDTLCPELEVDLLKVAKDIFCEQKLKDHKLRTIANTYGVDGGIQFHSALDDVIVLIRVLNAMVNDMVVNGIKAARRTLTVYKLNYYDGWRGCARLYAITSAGILYYDLRNDRWEANPDGNLSLTDIDMADVERQVFRLAGCTDYKELCRKCRGGAFTRSVPQKRGA